jgi:hypothetical protein
VEQKEVGEEGRKEKAGEVEGEKSKVRFLEQENLQLMMDAKQLKRELQGYKAELEAMRKTNVKGALRERKVVGGQENEENEGGESAEAVSKIPMRGIAAIAEGGELETVDEENTGECKQS